MNEELTEFEISTLREIQNGLKLNPQMHPIPSLVEKGYVYIEQPGKARLTESGKNYK